MTDLISSLESSITDPSAGLPEELFLFITRITPMINVDLLIKNESGHTLLTWRDDGYYPPGWHVPGGIVRYKETFADRLRAVARTELGADVDFDPAPVAVNEVIHSVRKNRGHFVSFLYDCRLSVPLDKALQCTGDSPAAGEWKWHAACPENLIEVHEIYRKFILP